MKIMIIINYIERKINALEISIHFYSNIILIYFKMMIMNRYTVYIYIERERKEIMLKVFKF